MTCDLAGQNIKLMRNRKLIRLRGFDYSIDRSLHNVIIDVKYSYSQKNNKKLYF